MVLDVRSLVTEFPLGGRSVPIVDQVSFRLEKGRCLALVGESGSGKSMTALSLLRLAPRPGRVTGGQVLLGDRDLLQLSVPALRQIRGHEIAMIFQEPMTSLNPVVRVGEQVVEAILLHEKVSRKAARERGVSLFRRVGIPEPERRFDAYPHQLSGGLKQRVMISMALVMRPRVLIADEPTTALDVTIQAQILELLRDLQREYETAILLITHDLGVVNELSDEVCVMYAGRIIERARTYELLSTPEHPYTQGLLGALPSRRAPGERLSEIAGAVPPPREWAAGCRFCTRCPEVLELCEQQVPSWVEPRPHQAVACHARLQKRSEG